MTVYIEDDDEAILYIPEWKWAEPTASYGDRFDAGFRISRIETNAWGAKSELIRDALATEVDTATYDGMFDSLDLPLGNGEVGEERSYRDLAEWSRRMIEVNPERFGHLPQTPEDWRQVADTEVQQSLALNQAIVASAPRGRGAATLGGLAGASTDEAAVGTALATFVLGPTVGLTRTVVVEGTLATAASVPVTQELRDTARRTGEEEPGYIGQAAMDAGVSMAIPLAGYGAVRAFRGGRRIVLGYPEQPSVLPPRQPSSGLSDVSQQVAERQTARALSEGDLSKVPDTTEEAVEGLRAGRGGRWQQFFPRSSLPQDGHGVSREALFALARLEDSSGQTFKVNSAYRDPQTNEDVGGARGSQHLHGNAFDIDVSGMSIPERVELIRQARAAGFGGVGVYGSSLHFDVGPTRHWGSDYHSGSLPSWAREAVQAPRGAGPQAPPSTAETVVDAGSGYTVIRMSDGTVIRREGSRAWRNNNPGNLEYGDFARSHGAVGTDGRFAVFPTYEAGRAAKAALIFESSSYRNLSLARAIARYAPQFENDTAGYLRQVADAAGVSPGTRMADLTPEQRVLVLDAMERVEGFVPGTENGVQATGPARGSVGTEAPGFNPSRMVEDTGADAGTVQYSEQLTERVRAVRDAVLGDEADIPDAPSASAPSRTIEPRGFERAPPGTRPSDKEPQRLTSFIVSQGGIYRGDDRGELAALGYNRPGFLVKDPLRRSSGGQSGGHSIDHMREAAAEAGYLPSDSTTADFLDLVARDVNGEKIVSVNDVELQGAWNDYYRDLEYRKMRADGVDVDGDFARAREAARSQPGDHYVDPDLAYFDNPEAQAGDVRAYVEGRVRRYLDDHFRAGVFSEDEIREVVDDLSRNGGDMEIAFEDMALREYDDMLRLEQEYDDGLSPPFPDEDGAGQTRSDASDAGGRGYTGAVEEAGSAAGRSGQGRASPDDPVWTVSEAQQRTSLPGRDLDPELDIAADEAIADFARQFEVTPEGEQTLIDGVEPVTQRDRLQALQNALLDGGARTDDSQIGGLFDLNERKIDDLFSIEMEDGRKVSPMEAVREAEADAEFLKQLKYCREGE